MVAMIGAEAAIANGFAAYKRGDLAGARSILERVPHHQAWHILGLVERAAGQYAQAISWLDRAEKSDPRNPEISNNKGRVALDAGDPIYAERSFRRALELRANWVPALIGFAKSLNDQEKWREAHPVWSEVVKQNPNDRASRYNAAMAALEIGHVEFAEREFDSLIRSGLTDPAVYFMRGRARVELSNLDAGLSDFRISWNRQKTAHAMKNLANTLWMTGDRQGFYDLVAEAPDEFGGLKMYLLSKAGDDELALNVWQELPEQFQTDPDTLTAKSNIHRLLGEGDAALSSAEKAHDLRPMQANIDDSLVSAQLMTGDFSSALNTLDAWRTKEPHVQSWIAHEATALRLAESPDYVELANPDKFIQAFELDAPDGFDSIQAFNDALIEAIAPMQSFDQRPLDQTLRAGTQTARDLVHVDDAVIQAFLHALDAPIRSYLESIGFVPEHPFLGRNRGSYRFNGCWSVTLKGGGHHVNHVHPRGWISSAYYARVPCETTSGEGRAGWIKFGEPPFETSPPLDPVKWVQPKAGLLVLFPSYYWHGTSPIDDGSERVTVPFDLVPG
ncbi:MAG: tetratricopeptide repeat protein [Alphaproteobacteria bacterium]|nr:tetratricopeptide repeat protein [Alphaproteobacteria bacterium]